MTSARLLRRSPSLSRAVLLRGLTPRQQLRLMERFEEKISPEPNTGCWLWTSAVTSRGYGTFRIADQDYLAHRLAFALWNGPIGAGLYVCHRCDQPLCVSPQHLFLGTPLENAQDCQRKGRGAVGDKNGSRTKPERRARGERVATARLTAEMVLAIRALSSAGATLRSLARENGVSPTAIAKIVKRESWMHLEVTP